LINALDFHKNLTDKSAEQAEAVERLLNCNCLQDETVINSLGRVLSRIPLKPNLSKMLVLGNKAKILEHAILAAACLSVEEVFVFPQIVNQPVFIDEDSGDEDKDLVTSID
jgi:HrpA-like RNA helicase